MALVLKLTKKKTNKKSGSSGHPILKYGVTQQNCVPKISSIGLEIHTVYNGKETADIIFILKGI